MTKIITQPFAYQGDQKVVPLTDASGFVNLTQGYTSDYEIDLNANNPRAKAVERPIQNYLFNLITENLQFWQQRGSPEWFSTMAGGYTIGALVARRTGAGVWQQYRSLTNANVSDPLTNPTQWAYVKSPAENLRDIPMPAGGAAGSGSELITVATDFNSETVTNGTFEVSTDAVAALCANLPIALNSTKKAGILEDKKWGTIGNANRTGTQRYLNADGVMFIRSLRATTWSAWAQLDSGAYFRAGGFRDYSTNSTIGGDGIGYIHRWLGASGTLTLQSLAYTAIQGQYIVNNGTGPVTINAFSGNAMRVANSTLSSLILQVGDWMFITTTSSTTQWEVVAGSILLYYGQTLFNNLVVAGTAGGDALRVNNGNIVAQNGVVKSHNNGTNRTGTLFDDGNLQGVIWAIAGNTDNYLSQYINIRFNDFATYVNTTFVRDVRWGARQDFGNRSLIELVAGGALTAWADYGSSNYHQSLRQLQKNINGTWYTAAYT